jgi:hypothetical protein
MKIAVGTRSRASGKEPSRVGLGRSSLQVAAILDCRDEEGARLFTVRVLDGRRFALRLRADDQWELAAAYGRAIPRRAPVRHPLPPLLALLTVALARKAFLLVRRAGRPVTGHHPSDLPGGGAPA